MKATTSFNNVSKSFRAILAAMVFLFFSIISIPASAHCDSYDGPTVKDALKALETNNVSLVLKWIAKDQEEEIISLFNKTYSLKKEDQEVYQIVEKHFLETLVRLHRETEGASFTGLKPAGTTEPIIQLSDHALEANDIDGLIEKLSAHMASAVKEKYQKTAALEKTRNNSAEQGRRYVHAYVDYTHTLEAIHNIIENGAAHSH